MIFYKHQRENWVDSKEDYAEKWPSFGHTPYEYLGQSMNFSSDSCTMCLIMICG